MTEQFPLSFYELQYGPEIIVENCEDLLKIEEGEHSPLKSESLSKEFKGCFAKRDPEKALMDKLIEVFLLFLQKKRENYLIICSKAHC